MDGSALLEIFLTSGITQMAKVAVDSFISFLKKSEYDFTNEKCEEIICEYLRRSYENNAKMSTIVFRGEQKTIFDLYIPLTIYRKVEANKEEILINEKAIKKLEKYKNIMIVDSAGMGKSTITKYLSVQSVIENNYIPVIIELRRLSKDKNIWQYLCELFDMFDQSIEYNDIKNLVKKGGFLIIFDGYDEVAESLRSNVINQIEDFTHKADKNLYILTSREEEDLCAFGEFCEFKINPLSLDEAYSLITQYGNNGERAKRLINVIKNDSKNFSVIKEFLVNPLLVSLLYKTYEYKEELPYKKIEFYRQVYEALYNDHDKSKDAYVHPKRCGLGIRDFELVLRYLAFFSMQKWCVEYESIHELMIDVKEAIDSAPGIDNVKPEDFIYDILHAVPIFQREGNAYKWAHKSFMEYFSAQCIYLDMSQEVKSSLLTAMTNSEKGGKYYNILDFYFDMDYKNFRKNVLVPFLEKFVNLFEQLKISYQDEGMSISDELLDIEASAQFFLNYKILYIENIEEPTNNKEMLKKFFNKMREKYGSGSMLYRHFEGIFWHMSTKYNIYVPRLFNEKNINVVRKFGYKAISMDSYWFKDLFDDIEYIDNMKILFQRSVTSEQIIYIYSSFFSGSNRITCLDGKKCRDELEKMREEIAKEEQMSKDRFSFLEID